MTLDFVVAQAFRGGADRVATSARASAIIRCHSRAMLQVSDHQVMSQGSSRWPSGGEHAASLKAETCCKLILVGEMSRQARAEPEPQPLPSRTDESSPAAQPVPGTQHFA